MKPKKTAAERAGAAGAAGAPFVALLRGINVGRAKRVAMADLRAVVEELGYVDVKTLLNSGNVVFTAPRATREDAAAARVRESLLGRCGVDSRVTVLAGNAVAAAVAENPLLDVATDPSRHFVAVFSDAADARSRLRPLAARSWTPEAFAVGDRVAYLWCPAGQLESPLAAALAKSLGDAVTTRNWATMTKLHALVAATS